MDLSNKNVVITGASSGLGRVVAIGAAQLGATVALIGRTESALRETQTLIGVERSHVFVCDIQDLAQVQSTVEQLRSTLSRVDMLINSAGVWSDNELEAIDPTRRQLAFDTNALGIIQFTEELLPVLQQQNTAHIFNVISDAGDPLSPGSRKNMDWRTYAATKWALSGYTSALRDALTNDSIKVTAFCPGGMNTNFFRTSGQEQYVDQPWMMEVNDIAEIVLFILTRPHKVAIESLTVTTHFT